VPLFNVPLFNAPLSQAALSRSPSKRLSPHDELATLNGGCAPASLFSLFHKPVAIVYVLFLF
jgi:hypothetical protein